MDESNKPRIPRITEMKPIVNKPGLCKGRVDLVPFIEKALDDDEVMNKLEPYKVNGGVTGRRQFDDFMAMQIILDFDKANGNTIGAVIVRSDQASEDQLKGYTLAEVSNKIGVALRRRYTLRNGKIIGENPKYYALLASPKAPTTGNE